MTPEQYRDEWNGTSASVGFKKLMFDWLRDRDTWVNEELMPWIDGGKTGTMPSPKPTPIITTDAPPPPDLP